MPGDDTRAENAEWRDSEEDEAGGLMAISWVFLKQKLLIRRLHVLKPFPLRGLEKGVVNSHISNFEFFLKSELGRLISVLGRFLHK